MSTLSYDELKAALAEKEKELVELREAVKTLLDAYDVSSIDAEIEVLRTAVENRK